MDTWRSCRQNTSPSKTSKKMLLTESGIVRDQEEGKAISKKHETKEVLEGDMEDASIENVDEKYDAIKSAACNPTLSRRNLISGFRKDEIECTLKKNAIILKECSVILERCDNVKCVNSTSLDSGYIVKQPIKNPKKLRSLLKSCDRTSEVGNTLFVSGKTKPKESPQYTNMDTEDVIGGHNAEVDITSKSEKNTGVDKSTKTTTAQTRKLGYRHSSRILKRSVNCKEAGDLEIEEIIPSDPLAPDPLSLNDIKPQKSKKSKNSTIVVNNTEQLFQIASSKRLKRKKEPTLVIIDTNSILAGKGPVPVSQISVVNPKSQPSIISGYSVMPINNSSRTIPSCSTILTSVKRLDPSTHPIQYNTTQVLSDELSQVTTNDDQIIEAPSFIVPYLYATSPKLSLKRYLEKLKSQSVSQRSETELIKSKDVNVVLGTDKKIEKSSYQEDNCKEKNLKDNIKFDCCKSQIIDTLVDNSNENTSEIKSKDITEKEKVLVQEHNTNISNSNTKMCSNLLLDEKSKGNQKLEKSDEYFKSPLGSFFIEIGLSLVQKYVHDNQLESSKKDETKLMEKNQQEKDLKYNMEDNKPFQFKLKRCICCNFKTESCLVMAHHFENPHEFNNEYKCNICNLIVENHSKITLHMSEEHNTPIILEKPPARYQCPFCSYEAHKKPRITSHVTSCSRKHKPDKNQEPSSDWEPPAKIIHRACNFSSKHSKPTSTYQMSSKGIRQLLPKLPANTEIHYSDVSVDHHNIIMPSKDQNPNGQETLTLNKPFFMTTVWQRPNVSITPVSNLQSSVSGVIDSNLCLQEKSGSLIKKSQILKICEICDSVYTDSKTLQNHLEDIHCVKFNKNTTSSTPSLKCQRCTVRFFTDLGLERHLLGSHGLVTPSIQEAAKNKKDGGNCPLCGMLFQWKLLDHVRDVHKISLKPVHISYKCTLCNNATFGKYNQFENHVFKMHGDRSKKKYAASLASLSKDALKSLENNNEITIISHIKTSLQTSIVPPQMHKSKKAKCCSKQNVPTKCFTSDEDGNSEVTKRNGFDALENEMKHTKLSSKERNNYQTSKESSEKSSGLSENMQYKKVLLDNCENKYTVMSFTSPSEKICHEENNRKQVTQNKKKEREENKISSVSQLENSEIPEHSKKNAVLQQKTEDMRIMKTQQLSVEVIDLEVNFNKKDEYRCLDYVASEKSKSNHNPENEKGEINLNEYDQRERHCISDCTCGNSIHKDIKYCNSNETYKTTDSKMWSLNHHNCESIPNKNDISQKENLNAICLKLPTSKI